MRLIKNEVNRIMAPFVRRKGYLYGRLFIDWEIIVGQELSKMTAPLKMAFYKNKPGTLIIQTTSAASLYINTLEEEIIQKINDYSKTMLVSKLQYKHVLYIEPVLLKEAIVIPFGQLQEIQELIDPIQDQVLRQNLKKLGMAILSQQKK